MRFLWPLIALVASGCSKCGEAPKPVDSVREVSPSDAGRLAQVGDLRTGLIITCPEFRGVHNLVSIAVLERKLATDPSDGGELVDALEPFFASKRWTRSEATDAGPMIAHNKPFFLEAEHAEGDAVVRVGIVMPGEEVVKLLQTPAPLTTQQLANLMPVPPGVKSKQDTYFFETHYFAANPLGSELVRNLIAGHVKTGWIVEHAPNALYGGDGGTVPDGFKAVLRDPQTQGTLTVGRVGDHNAITWEQVLAN